MTKSFRDDIIGISKSLFIISARDSESKGQKNGENENTLYMYRVRSGAS